jgi:ribose-phosphate pyrophosphokinase
VVQDMAVFTGNAHPAFAEATCKHLEIPLGEAEVFQFSNENTFVRFLQNMRERDVFIVQPLIGDVNTAIMELLIMIDAAKRASAGRITAVIPYFAYGRSDKKDQPHISITARLLANFIEVAGADRVLTANLHAGQIQGFFNVPVDELHAMPLIAEYFLSLNLDNPIIVAPDAGRAKESSNLAARLSGDVAFVDKRREGNDERASATTIVGPDVRDRDTILYDDEILTGGTMQVAIEMLKQQGARSVYLACIHGYFRGSAFERLDSAEISGLVYTDTVPVDAGAFERVPTHVISLAPLFGDAMHRIHTGGSVSALFG